MSIEIKQKKELFWKIWGRKIVYKKTWDSFYWHRPEQKQKNRNCLWLVASVERVFYNGRIYTRDELSFSDG